MNINHGINAHVKRLYRFPTEWLRDLAMKHLHLVKRSSYDRVRDDAAYWMSRAHERPPVLSIILARAARYHEAKNIHGGHTMHMLTCYAATSVTYHTEFERLNAPITSHRMGHIKRQLADQLADHLIRTMTEEGHDNPRG